MRLILILAAGLFTLFTTISAVETATITRAFADLEPTKGNQVRGRVTFTAVKDGVIVTAVLENLTPGAHGFHIHEKGDCSAEDGSSAGDHFNPTSAKHGGPEDADRHVGDLGNIIADEKGRAYYQRLDKKIRLEGPNSVIGRSVVVHAKKDDFHTQPTGDSGARQACGVIKAIEN